MTRVAYAHHDRRMYAIEPRWWAEALASDRDRPLQLAPMQVRRPKHVPKSHLPHWIGTGVERHTDALLLHPEQRTEEVAEEIAGENGIDRADRPPLAGPTPYVMLTSNITPRGRSASSPRSQPFRSTSSTPWSRGILGYSAAPDQPERWASITRYGPGHAERPRIFVALAQDAESFVSHLAVGAGTLEHGSASDAHRMLLLAGFKVGLG
jgi:hypothetical protein